MLKQILASAAAAAAAATVGGAMLAAVPAQATTLASDAWSSAAR